MDDQGIRLAAMHQCALLRLKHAGAVPWPEIQRGCIVDGVRVHLGSTPRGIHKPAQMRRGALSIKTTIPKSGKIARYLDEVRDDDYFGYAFQGDDPSNHDNQALRESHEDGTPVIYFRAITKAVYEILFPCFIATWDPVTLRCTVSVGSEAEMAVNGPRVAQVERRYTTIAAKVRLHQARFRELVLGAYQRRCAISNLPLPDLLDAAHIIPDRDQRGLAEIPNGICLSQLHHRAYDCNLIGIDPDGQVHVARHVLEQHDGPTLEAIKASHGTAIRLPSRQEDQPRRAYLEERFAAFRRAI